MATITASDFRNGVTVEYDGKIWTVIEFMHVKPGKGAAFVRTKLKNIKTGNVIENSFNPTAKFETAHIEKKSMELSYSDDDFFYFMDSETYDMVPVARNLIENDMRFVKDNTACVLSSHNGEVFSAEPPINVTLLVTKCEPGIKGNTTTNATKPCTLETGAEVKVPLFVNEGDSIVIDTRTGEYSKRA